MSFFRIVEVSAADAACSAGVLRAMRRGELEGILVRQLYEPLECARFCERLEDGRHGLVQSNFPAAMRAYFLGMNLNLTPPDLTAYFAAVPQFRERLQHLLAGSVDLETRICQVLGTLDGNCAYRAAPGPEHGPDHMFTTIRAHMTGGFIPPHFDNEQAFRESYRFIRPRIGADLFSFVIAFSQAEAGGDLEIFNLQHEGRPFRMMDGEQDASRLDLTSVESVRFRLAPGELILFNSGRYLHRVNPVAGARTRWTACSFMAESRDGRQVYCWG